MHTDTVGAHHRDFYSRDGVPLTEVVLWRNLRQTRSSCVRHTAHLFDAAISCSSFISSTFIEIDRY